MDLFFTVEVNLICEAPEVTMLGGDGSEAIYNTNSVIANFSAYLLNT